MNKESRILYVISIIKSMNKAGVFFELGDDFGMRQDFIKKIEKLKVMAVLTTKQTALIPSHIYSEFINSSFNVLKTLNENLYQLEKYFNEVFPTVTHSRGRAPSIFLKIIKNSGLFSYCEYFNIRTNHQLMFNLALIQALGVFMVGCFTGMRKGEILDLGRNCLQKNIIEGREVYLINGYTSKTTSLGVRKATWITSKTIVSGRIQT